MFFLIEILSNSNIFSYGYRATSRKVDMKYFILCFGLLLSQVGNAHFLSDMNPMSFKKGTLLIYPSFEQAPTVGTESFLLLSVKDAQTKLPVEIQDQVEVTLWMPSMGHGSAPTQVERVIDSNGDIVTGTFLVRNVYFIMPGYWEVQVSLSDDKGQSEMQKFDVFFEGDHGGHHH